MFVQNDKWDKANILPVEYKSTRTPFDPLSQGYLDVSEEEDLVLFPYQGKSYKQAGEVSKHEAGVQRSRAESLSKLVSFADSVSSIGILCDVKCHPWKYLHFKASQKLKVMEWISNHMT